MHHYIHAMFLLLLTSTVIQPMHQIRQTCKPVARNICYQRPFKIKHIKNLVEGHKQNPDSLDDLRTHLQSLCNGFENFIEATNQDDFHENTPDTITTEIETSIMHAHYRTKARGYLYAGLGTVTGSMAIALALKTGDFHFVQETMANISFLIGSVGSLSHTAHYALVRAHDDLIYGNVNIEANIILNTALLRDYLKTTEPEL